MKKINWKNVLSRALWTFLEGFVAGIPTVAVISEYTTTDLDSLKKFLLITLLGCLASGISAVKTIIVEIINQMKKGEE